MAQSTIFQIADLLGCARPERDKTILEVSGIPYAGAGSLVFAADEEMLAEAVASGAGAILSRQPHADARVLAVGDPRTAFARVYREWFDEPGGGGVHATAVIAESAVLGAECEVGPGCVIEANVRLGEHCRLGPRVTIHAGTVLGDRVRVQAGAVLGSYGFGYAREASGHLPFPQIGRLVIGDDVDIGANSTIDRGALGETRIGSGTKIDNLVHIAHNCVIGERVLIAAQVGLAGSITVEDDAMLGGQAGLGERVTIGRGVILGGQGGVLPGKTLEGPGVVFWGTPAQPVREYLRGLARMRKG